MDSPSKSGESSSWRKESPRGASSTFFSKYVGNSSSEEDWRKPNSKLAAAVSSGDGSRSPVTPKPAKVFHLGTVLNVKYEKGFGFLSPILERETWSASTSNVYFKLGNPMATTVTSTGGIRLIPGDIMEYEIGSNSTFTDTPRAHIARLRECKPRNVKELEWYVDSLLTAAKQQPEIVLRVLTKCSIAFKLVLDYRAPSDELIQHTLQLCQVLSCSRAFGRGLYHSRLKQMYALFAGSPFLTSQRGVRSWAKYLSGSEQRWSELLQGFLVHLLEFSPSQLPTIAPLILTRIPRKSETIGTLFTDLDLVLPLLHAEGKAFLEKALEALILSDDAENFYRKILAVLAGGSSCKEIPWSQLPLLPTLEEVQTVNLSTRSNLPVVKQIGPYDGPEEYLDTYLRLLREDCFAGLLQGIQALCQGKPEDCDMKLWSKVSACGVHFGYNASPGLTLAFMLPKSKSKAPLAGSLVCFFEDDGGFECPIWGVASRCEEDAVNKCTICFVDIIVLNVGAESLNSDTNSWCFQCARLMQGKDMVMAESPTYYKAYHPVLETLQLTDPESVPFREELVSVTWPQDPAPEYLSRTDGTVTLDWSCIFATKLEADLGNLRLLQPEERCPSLDSDEDWKEPSTRGEIREGVGAATSLLERGYKTSFDPSQLKAVELAVHNRLAMIQGPPGTGKTHVGVKLLQLLLSASTFPKDSPIFVITLKNHALDQFLERCLAFEPNIVRVGGRSKSPKLEPYNLHGMIKSDDEFRFDFAENRENLGLLRDDMKEVFDIVKRYLDNFDPSMIVERAPELHLHHFLERAVHPRSRMESFVRKLPEGLTLVELLRGGSIPGDADPTLVSDVLIFRQLLIAEMKRWMPSSKVLQCALAFLSLKKPVSSRISQRDQVSAVESVLPDEEDERRKEEEERRAAYESLRQEINLDMADPRLSKPSIQWLLSSSFMKFSKEKNVSGASMKYHRLNLDTIGGQFDWIAHENPYDLLPEHRAILVYRYWQESVNRACERLTSMKAEYDTLLQDTEQIRERRKLVVLRKAKIIGMTTTGAAIHQSVIKHLSPAVVLVEEAAEILEPQVLASLNSNLQHLILIGDHQQLRPQVESYELERSHGFGVSMFERLVEHNKLPCQQLGLQCRMREEFVEMLRPIYPDLKSQTKLVSGSRNEAPTFMVRTMYFWSHPYPETSQRSFVNQDEARMVVALTRWIASELSNLESLKILAAYNGQVTLIRSLVGNYPELTGVEVRSIDSFQGSESEIVIVSLVRSNGEGKIGHLGMRNRMCVAASRARRGVYFVGNHDTLARKSDHWRTLINHFDSLNAIDSYISLCCPRHPDKPPFSLCNTEASQFEPRDVCGSPCQEILPCTHVCSHTCHSGPHTVLCQEPVEFTFRLCGHSRTRKCHQFVEDLCCHKKVIHKFTPCEHSKEEECWKVTGAKKLRLKCQVLCGKKLDKCGHMCKLYCSDSCESASCEDCLEIERAKEKIRLQIRIEAIANKKKELEEDIAKLNEKGSEGIVVTQVHPDDDTARSYFLAKDRAEKYTQPDSKVMVVVTKVQKIENLTLRRKFLEAHKELFDPLEIPELLFYGGSDDLLDQVANKGFRAARDNKAHRFDVYSSSVAQNQENQNFLLCEVLLGKTWRLPSSESLDKVLDRGKLRNKGCDSVSMVGRQENEEESRPIAHVIFNQDQAIPLFMVSFKLVNFQALAEDHGFERFGEDIAIRNGGVCRLELLPSLHVQGLTPEDYHFRVAESQFFRMSQNRKMRVMKVEYIKNVRLEEKFKQKKEEFKASNVAVEQQFVFHGTDSAAIAKIATEGFKIGGVDVAIKCGASYGRGVYTASNPDISVRYCRGSKMMLLSTAILGALGSHHNSGGSEDVHVIKDASQLLPRYVVHYSNSDPSE